MNLFVSPGKHFTLITGPNNQYNIYDIYLKYNYLHSPCYFILQDIGNHCLRQYFILINNGKLSTYLWNSHLFPKDSEL